MKEILFGLIARIYTAWVHRLERKIDYRVKFSNIPEVWINSMMIFDMQSAWARHGIKASGVNYFTVGSLVNGISSRFIRNEKQYQSWLGAYLVKFKDKRDFTLQDHFNLAIADQKNWLKDFGDPSPFMEMVERNVGKIEPFNVGPYKGKLYEFLGGPSHSDVGKNSLNTYNKILMAIMAQMMNLYNPDLKLSGHNFLPKDLFLNYEMVTLLGYIAIIELEENTKVVLYGNAAAIKGQYNKNVDYFPLLKDDMLTVFKSVTIEKLK